MSNPIVHAVIPPTAAATATTPLPADPPPHLFHAAFDRTAPARAALKPEDLVPINLDVQTAITTVLGILPGLKALRSDIAAAFTNFDLAQFDALQPYAEALSFAQGAYLAAFEPVEALPALVARAAVVRDQLVSDATALAHRGLLPSAKLDQLKGGPGFLNIASDLSVLVQVMRARWSEIASRSAIQAAELDEAEQLQERITFAYAERAHPSVTTTAAQDTRQRAFTLLVKAYDQARRAATYLRWVEGDTDKLVPSLWAGRGGRGSSASATPPASAPVTSPTDPTTPVPAPGNPVASPAPTATAPAAPSPFHPEPRPAAPFAPPGARGSNPFTS